MTLSVYHKKTVLGLLIFVTISAIAIFNMLFSCSARHKYPAELAYADSLCKDSAEYAMEYLKSLSAKYENPETDENARYYYMLLKVKAANNAYKPLNDSTIFHVFNFFKTTADKEKLCQSYYYVGKYYVQNNDAPQALENFQKSLDLTDESTPLYFRSCIYNQTGRLLYFQSMFDEALDMYQRSYKCDSIIGDTISVLYSMRDIATIYNFKNDFRKCLTLLGKAYKLSKHTNDKGLTNSISQSLAICYFDTGDLAK